MPSIDLSEEGFEDLREIYQQDKELAAELFTRIQEISGDQNILASLTSNHYEEVGSFNIKLYQKAREQRFYVYRIRFFKRSDSQDHRRGVNDYRLFYFLKPGTGNFIIIAINRKYKNGNIDHPYDDPEFLRILKERYDANFTS